MLIFVLVVTGGITIVSVCGIFALVMYVYLSKHRKQVITCASSESPIRSSSTALHVLAKNKYRPVILSVEQNDALQDLLEELRNANRKDNIYRKHEINTDILSSIDTKKGEHFVRANDSPMHIIDIYQTKRLREALVYGNHG